MFMVMLPAGAEWGKRPPFFLTSKRWLAQSVQQERLCLVASAIKWSPHRGREAYHCVVLLFAACSRTHTSAHSRVLTRRVFDGNNHVFACFVGRYSPIFSFVAGRRAGLFPCKQSLIPVCLPTAAFWTRRLQVVWWCFVCCFSASTNAEKGEKFR